MPLSFDLPLKELQTYQGRNPRPDDFDPFWERGLAEMRAVDPQVELVKAEFQAPFADCFHLYFTGVGGARIHAKLVRPKEAPTTPQPAVLMFHGYSGSAGDWLDKLPYAAAGLTVAAMDCRGQGGSSNDSGGVSGNTLEGHIIRGLPDALAGNPDKLLFRQIFLDTAQLASIVMPMPTVDATRVGATGGSQGGALTVACAALVPQLKRIAPVYPYLSDYLRIWEMDLAVDAYGEIRDWFRRFDPQHKRQDEVFRALGYIDIQHLARRVQAKTEWYIGLADTICPPSSQYAVYNKLTCEKRMLTFPDFGHEDFPARSDAIFEFMLGL